MPEEGPAAEPRAPADPAAGAAPSRAEALKGLRGTAADFSSVRSGRIVAEGISRAGGATINVFQGDFAVYGGFTAGGGRTAGRRPGRRPTPVRLADVEYYVEPAGFESGVDTLDTQNLVIFTGKLRSGRRSQALATVRRVLECAKLDLVVHELGDEVLGDPTWRVPHARCGLLVEDRQGRAESVDDTWLTLVAERLRDQGSFLVVATGPVRGTLATAPKRADYVVTVDLPDPMEIVRRRVLGEQPWLSPADLDDRLAGTELAELLDEREGPEFATRAANAVIGALRKDSDLAEAVARLRDPRDQVQEWLDSEPDVADIAFVFATAVLEGASYLHVADAAVALYRRIGTSKATTTPRYLRALTRQRSWIEYVEHVDGPPLVRFRHANLRPVVLALTWFEFDGAREAILAWLTAQAQHDDVEVRTRAAVAAGMLSTNDFGHGMHSYLKTWAASPSATLRLSAAWGLNVAGQVSDHADTVWAYLEQWADLVRYDANARDLPATAALALGGPLGAANPARALRVLRVLVCDGDWGFLAAAASTAHMLLEEGRVSEVLDALTDWTDPTAAEEPLAKALTMFTYAAAAQGADRPVLLLSAARFRDELAELWGRALNHMDVHEQALEGLRTWVRVADRDPTVRDDVLLMLAGVADRDHRDYDQLLHALRDWATDPDDPSAAADDFRRELSEAGELLDEPDVQPDLGDYRAVPDAGRITRTAP
ncbi:hypothetical protein [Actinocrispum wychmicini]|uniref:LigA protein n=1 Tax=Actinocrispum wychmicini TaxID=1213861 RepID=A0A4R2IYB8_9PSEU|nr:hypothetical protein [Actinocrispum wychmicini]TCO48919.1 hypothetical protein EV192_115140 [Actinocrispum wychmicini]